MRTVEHYVEEYHAAVQRCVPDERVLAIGLFGTPPQSPGDQEVRGPVLMALTPSRLLAHRYRPRGMSIDVLERVAAWPRRLVGVRVQDHPAVRRLLLTTPDGALLRFHGARQPGAFDGLNESFLEQLAPGAG